MTRTPIIYAALTLTVLLLTGCEGLDPYRRSDVWHPTGTPQENLAAMVANPQDLIHGRGAGKSDPKVANTAIQHIWTDTPKPLLDATGQSGGGGGAGGSGGGAGSGGGGAAPAGG